MALKYNEGVTDQDISKYNVVQKKYGLGPL